MRHQKRRPEVKTPAGPPLDMVIQSVGGEGDGVATGPVYVPFTLPGEAVRVAGSGENRTLVERLSDSPDRTDPSCPHFGTCGGCALQHWADAPYLAWKVERLRKTLQLQRIETDILTPVPASPGTRRRLALHARPGKKGMARLGFKARKSWDVIDLEACTIADPRLVAALPALRRLAAPLFEHPKSAPTLHVTLADHGRIDVDITGVEAKSGGLSADARMQLAEIASESGFARVTLDGEVTFLDQPPSIRLGPATVSLPAGGFLQAVPSAERAMAAFVTNAATGAGRIADLYCGVGTFTFRLAELAPVYAVDSSAAAIRALSSAMASAPGLKGVTAEARDLARRPVLAVEFKKIDLAVFDPPRAGAIEQSGEMARSGLSCVIGVSCNPATFARDARVLLDAGFRLDQVLPVDQFLWSPHVELVGIFNR